MATIKSSESWQLSSENENKPIVHCKGSFYSESVIRFSNLPKKYISNNYPELEI